jgi:predicted secreted protein
MTAHRLWLLTSVAVSATACGAATKPVEEAHKVLTEADAGPTVHTVRTATAFQVRLAEQPGTGFGWIMAPDPAVEQPVPSAVSAGAGLPGGVQTRVFTVAITKTGRHTLRFNYSQPWQGGQKDGKLLLFTFNAR